MKKAKFRFVNVLLVVLLVLNQTAFFVVADFVKAATTDIIVTDTVTTTTTDTVIDVDTNYILAMEFITVPAVVSGIASFSVKTSEQADSVMFYIYQDNAKLNSYQGNYQDNNTYYFKWDSSFYKDGQYTVEAYAVKSGYIDIYKRINVTVDNTLMTTDNIIDDNIVPDALAITIVEQLQSPIVGDYRITINASQKVDKVDFIVNGPLSKTFAGIKKDDYHYYFVWPTAEFPDGFYKIIITAYQGANKADLYDSIEIKNNLSPDILLPPPDEYYPEKIIQPITEITIKEPIIEQPIFEVLPECQKNNINSMEECKRFMSLPPECRYKGLLIWEECDRYMMTPPECRDKGLSMEECNKLMMVPLECRKQGILDPEECKKHMFRFAMPLECQRAGATTPEECNKIIFISSMPPECIQAGAATKEECGKIMSIQNFLTFECKNANITTPEECDKYMMEKHLPPECREAGVSDPAECGYLLREKHNNLDNLTTFEFKPVSVFDYYEEEQGMPMECLQVGIITPEECDKIMFARHMPPECQQAGAATKEECDKIMFARHMPMECQEANIINPTECDKHMMKIHMPMECQQAGAADEKQCEEILFKKHAPKECIEAGILTPEECEKFMFKKFAPDDCREAGIVNPEACKKYMFEKYGGKEKIPADKLPIECQQAGAKTADECDKVMREKYMPKECKDQGIIDEMQCDIYMQQKYMPKECREAGATTRSECDKIMFKKYAPEECIAAGIENESECENYMFNKYAPQVICHGVDDWQCKNSIRERHLGNIVATQVQFNELKEKAGQIVNQSMTVNDLEAILEAAKEIIPIKKKQTGLKIVTVDEQLILDEDENLIQTAPIALMIDSDGDGLSDDMEKRLGTDPKNPDSDGDGYSDGAEVENRHNPSGTGKLQIAMAPIDQAILANKTLGQPKTEGEVSENLAVTSIVNLTDEQNGLSQGYDLSGQAEPNSVATLYIYSDLPIVATVQADEYGNWQYEFSESLVEGEHEIYVAVNDNTGKVLTKSNPLNFFVKEAKAVSVKDFVATSAIAAQQESETMIKYYIIIAILTVIVGILLFVVFIIQKRKQGLKI